MLQVCIATESFIRDVHDEKRELSLAIVRHGQWNGSIPAERPELHSVVELWQRLLENFIPEIDVDHEVDHLKRVITRKLHTSVDVRWMTRPSLDTT